MARFLVNRKTFAAGDRSSILLRCDFPVRPRGLINSSPLAFFVCPVRVFVFCLSVCLPVGPVRLVYLSVCLFVRPSACLPLGVFLSLSVRTDVLPRSPSLVSFFRITVLSVYQDVAIQTAYTNVSPT